MSSNFQPLEGTRRLEPWKGVAGVYLPSLVAFVALDFFWIKVIANNLYADGLADLPKADPPRAWAALASWLCIVGLVYVFVLPLVPLVKPGRREYLTAIYTGAAMGFLLYGTVDFTNHAVIKDWSLPVTLVDVVWGTVACTFCAVVQTALRGLWV